MTADPFVVVGAGAWGSALANALTRAGRTVVLCGRDRAAVEAIAARRENARLPGIRLADGVTVTDDPAAVRAAGAVLLAVPAQAMRQAADALGTHLRDATPVIACAKGIERGTQRFMTTVIAEALPQAVPAILSGPSFAADVARGLPTAVAFATADEGLARSLAAACGSPTFRPYHSTDIRGVEIGGAAKNVLAIAAGIVAGRKLGASAAAALTTRGFAELVRFGRAFGARPETLTGLSGLGDLLLTCSTMQSRNFSYGIVLGEGRAVEVATVDRKLVEGASTASVLAELARAHAVEMPIATAVAAVVEGRLSVDEAIESLLTRPLRGEM
jgi:glycerol-3-phosphate dehydrogenase (NAD(P)+)